MVITFLKPEVIFAMFDCKENLNQTFFLTNTCSLGCYRYPEQEKISIVIYSL